LPLKQRGACNFYLLDGRHVHAQAVAMDAAGLGRPSDTLDTTARTRLDNTHLAPGVNQQGQGRSARPRVGGAPSGTPSYNARQVYPHDSTSDSATVDVFTGILDTGRLTEVRDRAIYDENTLTWNPLADSGTGVLFPDAVTAKTNVESSLRARPTTFKGPKQLDISYESQDQHFNRQIHPNAWRGGAGGKENQTAGAQQGAGNWYKSKGDLPFVGYPNPNLFYAYTDAIPTHNVQNLSHAQLTDAMRAAAAGDFDHDGYLNTVGSLLRSDAVPRGPAAANIREVIQTDGGGVDGDPRLAEIMAEEYETQFSIAQRMRVAEAESDPRFIGSGPGAQFIDEQNAFHEAQETQFSKVSEWTSVPSGWVNPSVRQIG
jgi:hypothetical protein